MGLCQRWPESGEPRLLRAPQQLERAERGDYQMAASTVKSITAAGYRGPSDRGGDGRPGPS
jgi:hypothetical protein